MQKITPIGTIHKIKNTNTTIQITLKTNIQIPTTNNLKFIFINIQNNTVPYPIQNITITQNIAKVKLKNIDKTHIHELKNLTVLIPSTTIKQKQQEIIGYHVLDSKNKYIGQVTDIQTHTKQTTIIVKNKNLEIPIPYQPGIIQKVIKNKQQIHVTLHNNFIETFAKTLK